eukprot:jgi/Mesvir1/4244/Mv22212-RA.1
MVASAERGKKVGHPKRRESGEYMAVQILDQGSPSPGPGWVAGKRFGRLVQWEKVTDAKEAEALVADAKTTPAADLKRVELPSSISSSEERASSGKKGRRRKRPSSSAGKPLGDLSNTVTPPPGLGHVRAPLAGSPAMMQDSEATPAGGAPVSRDTLPIDQPVFGTPELAPAVTGGSAGAPCEHCEMREALGEEIAEQMRQQVESLLREKAETARENARLVRENKALVERIHFMEGLLMKDTPAKPKITFRRPVKVAVSVRDNLIRKLQGCQVKPSMPSLDGVLS